VSGRALVLRRGTFSVRISRRAVRTSIGLLLACLVAFVAAMTLGEFMIPPHEALMALIGAADSGVSFVILDLRLPRALVALMAGAALGIAGLIFQDLSRNPLVAPDVIGVSSGAAAAVVCLIVFGDGGGVMTRPLVAIAGAVLAGALLYGLAWRKGVDGVRLVLIGIGLAALFQAAIAYLLTRGRILDASEAYIWLVGSLNGRGTEHVLPLLIGLIIVTPLLPYLARRLGALQLGDDLAGGLGVPVERARLALLATAVLLTAVAVSAAGPLAFVAFIAPHIARAMVPDAGPGSVMVVAALSGALLVTLADVAGSLMLSPGGVPAGILTSLVAAPYFLWLLHRNRSVEVGP
jgi:iron complex transport system permease protein